MRKPGNQPESAQEGPRLAVSLPRGDATFSVLLGASLISTAAVWVRLADAPPTTSAFYRLLVGAVTLHLWSWATGTHRGWTGAVARPLMFCAAAFAVDLFVWHRCILYVGPGLATLLANLQVLILAFLGALFLNEKLSARLFAAMTLCLGGIGLLVLPDWGTLSPQYVWGLGLGFFTAAAYSAYLLSLRWTNQVLTLPSPHIMAWVTLHSAWMVGLSIWVEGGTWSIGHTQGWFSVVANGIICQSAGWLLISRGLPSVPVSVAGVLILLQPALAFVWDVAFFHRATTAMDLAGLGLVLLGLFLARR